MSFISPSLSAPCLARWTRGRFSRRVDVIAYGKKRIKRQERAQSAIDLGVDVQPTVAEYLVFGEAIGLTVEKSLKALEAKAFPEKLKLDAEDKAAIQKFKKRQELREKMRQEKKRAAADGTVYGELLKQMNISEDDFSSTAFHKATWSKDLSTQIEVEEIKSHRAGHDPSQAEIEEDIERDGLMRTPSVQAKGVSGRASRNGPKSENRTSHQNKAVPSLAERPSLLGETPREKERKEKEAAKRMRKKTRKPLVLRRPSKYFVSDEDTIQQPSKPKGRSSQPSPSSNKVFQPKRDVRLRPKPKRDAGMLFNDGD